MNNAIAVLPSTTSDTTVTASGTTNAHRERSRSVAANVAAVTSSRFGGAPRSARTSRHTTASAASVTTSAGRHQRSAVLSERVTR
ncbi:Uncharacterised protein [Mycobacteroides abscessus]|nr:Uncharacterised protein [Mycobacteroides abscessus]